MANIGIWLTHHSYHQNIPNIRILEYWMWPYVLWDWEYGSIPELQSQQVYWMPEHPVTIRMWRQARRRVQENWEDFGRNMITVNSWNYWDIWPLYVHGRITSERLTHGYNRPKVKHLVYWYEGGWIYHRYSSWEIRDWINRNRYSETTHGALVELESGLLQEDEGRCEFCGRMFRICTLATTYDANACIDPWL